MRVGLLPLLSINTQASDVSSSGLSVFLLHYRLQGSPLGQLLLVAGLELTGGFVFISNCWGEVITIYQYLSFFSESSADCSKEECPNK